MPEIKHNFAQGKMNKDLDERLVPNGQYIDANNIQVSTSEGSNVGVVQSLLGNTALTGTNLNDAGQGITTMSSSGVCVGAIADEKNDCAYWLIASSNQWDNSIPASITTYKDVIYKTEYNGTSNTHTVTPVFIDFYSEKHPNPSSSDWVGDAIYTAFTTTTTNLSTGMYAYFVTSTPGQNNEVRQITKDGSIIRFDGVDAKTWDYIEFSWNPTVFGDFYDYNSNQKKSRVLRFDKDKLITGINIVDDLLFWTDNNSEPKKINIPRSIQGTDINDLNKNTKAVVEQRNILADDDNFVTEEDVTIIKKSPKIAPFLDIKTGVRPGNSFTNSLIDFNGKEVNSIFSFTTNIQSNYKVNDILVFANGFVPDIINNHVRARVTFVENLNIQIVVLSINNTIPSGPSNYKVYLEEDTQPIFKEKFARFATRWKYIDGEYSSISPFSEPAFGVGDFNYNQTKGFNSGMVNTLKELVIKKFIPKDIPKEVVQVDILYKESNSPVIYTVDNVFYNSPSWSTTDSELDFQGVYTISSENIYSAIPSNQILRPWDSVPRKALAQSVIGNRVVYGNYLENYDIKSNDGSTIKPKINAFINFRSNVGPQLLQNPNMYRRGGVTSSVVANWNYNASSSSKNGWINDYYAVDGFIEQSASGVDNFMKIWQTLTLEDNKTYLVSIEIEEYVQGSVRLHLVGPTKNNYVDIDDGGVKNFELTLNKLNSAEGVESFYTSGKTFMVQAFNLAASTPQTFKGKIKNFSCKQRASNKNKSIKSQRTYQLGVVYADQFGRQTPVLTSETSSIKVPKIDSGNINAINVGLYNTAPEFAESFKFFIKETSSEYYNLAVDRIYDSTDGMAWLSFPSNERNKVDEETYLVLKKQLNGQAVISESSTYKVLAISNETPSYLKLSRNELGTADGSWSASNTLNAVFTNSSYRPSEDQLVLRIEKDLWLSEENGADLSEYGDLILRFESGSLKSGWLKADAVNTAVDGKFYTLHLNKPIIKADSDWIMDGANFNNGVAVTIASYKTVDRPEFDGKFFVKVELDNDLKQFVQQQAVLTQDSFGIVAKSPSWYVSDDGASGVAVGTGTATRYQKDSSSSGDYNQFSSVKGFTYDSNLGESGGLPFTKEVSFTDATCDVTNGSNEIDCDPTLAIQPSWHVSGAGIKDNSYVTEIIGIDGDGKTTKFQINQNADASNNNTTLTFKRWHEDKGHSGYNAGRGVPTFGFSGAQSFTKLYMSQGAVRNWGRILKFAKYSTWNYENIPDNDQARKNFFIDRVHYVGIQPLDENDPAKGIYTDPGHYDHHKQRQNNARSGLAGASLFPQFGRGIFQADGTEIDIKGEKDEFFKHGKYYMELSYAKIWSESSLMNIPQEKVSLATSYATAWDVGKATNKNHELEIDFVSKLKVGSKFRFSGDPNEKIFEISNLKQQKRYNHTVFPGGNGDYTVLKMATHNGTQKELKASQLRGKSTVEEFKCTVKAFGAGGHTGSQQYFNRFQSFFLGTSLSSSFFTVNGKRTIEDEEALFGLATNRRLTWIIEFKDVTVTQSGQAGPPNYNPLNKTSGRSTTGTVGSVNLMDEINDQFIEFVESSLDDENQLISNDPAIFETQPKTDDGLDIYYEASDFIDIGAHDDTHELPWFNCYSFGNGVESNRIKDDFNQVFVDKNAIVSTTLQGEYEENQRKYGLIYSGIYNSKSGVNDTNQFIAAEKITKDINPDYGSIQKLYARNSDLLTLCEDKVLRIQANKDALFNADGDVNVVATTNVLGQTIPFAGDYGISKNPESFAAEAYRVYFTDKQRGTVLRLSMDGLTPISDYGMRDWFKDNLRSATEIAGSYDINKKEYNVTLKPGEDGENYTVSYNEDVKGWSSFKSFIPEKGLSVSGNYYTFASPSGNSKVWWHHQGLPLTTENGVSAKTANNFYGTQYYSDVTTVFNEEPSMVKVFKALSYEGTQSKIHQNTSDTENYYNLVEDEGWHAEAITTDKQTGSINEFLEKEGKWFNFIKGDTTTLTNLDTSEFTVQGLGKITAEDIS